MASIPSQPHKLSATWGEAYGLFSFEVSGVLVASLLSYMTSMDGGIMANILMTTLFSALYVAFVEAKVPGALSQRRYRASIAARSTVLFSVFAVSASLTYEGIRLLDNDGVGAILALVLLGILVSFVSVLIGLEIGFRCTRWKRSRAGHGASM
jgi:hypothetical protein